jgi:hypothetical protein
MKPALISSALLGRRLSLQPNRLKTIDPAGRARNQDIGRQFPNQLLSDAAKKNVDESALAAGAERDEFHVPLLHQRAEHGSNIPVLA